MGWMQIPNGRNAGKSFYSKSLHSFFSSGRSECEQSEEAIFNVTRWLKTLGLDVVGYDLVTIGGALYRLTGACMLLGCLIVPRSICMQDVGQPLQGVHRARCKQMHDSLTALAT